MVKNTDMNWIQRLLYGVRWRILTRTCPECGGCGKEKRDRFFDCKECKGTGLERVVDANTGAFDSGLIAMGFKVEVKGLLCDKPTLNATTEGEL